MFMMLQLSIIPCLLLHLQAAVATGQKCYPEGPLVPKPVNLTDSPAFTDAMRNLTGILDDASSGKINVSWPVENVSFSVGVVAFDQEEPNVPIWEYHHLAKNNAEGTRVLDRHSQWLIGSVSKVFTTYIMLTSGIDIDKSVIEYLPELRNASSKSPWENITLKMLSSHLAGVPVDCKYSI